MPPDKQHWDAVHEESADDDLSWFVDGAPEPSLQFVRQAAPSKEARILDVGGGIGRLVDALLDEDFRNVAVLDISARALARTRERLGARAALVEWHEADVTRFEPPHVYDVWHDRAVLHFLTRAEDQRAYVRVLERSLAAHGEAVIGTFAPDGPEKCSGLPVARHDEGSLAALLGQAFERVESRRHVHTTPWGTAQAFTWCRFRRA